MEYIQVKATVKKKKGDINKEKIVTLQKSLQASQLVSPSCLGLKML